MRLTSNSAVELARLDSLAAEPSSRPKILAVDDDSRNLLALAEVLNEVAEVVCVESGDEALRHLLKDQFAVILLDVLMPGLDGYETARLMRMREQSRDTPIIFLTAINKEPAHLSHGYDSGAVDYVFKPFDASILRSKVAVFVSLYEKTKEIERKARREQELLQERLCAQAEKALADQALLEAEQRQALILRSLPLAVYTRDELGAGLQFIAGDVHGLTGFQPEDFQVDRELWLSRIHPEDASEAGSINVSEPGIREYRWRHRDESYRYFMDHWAGVPGRDHATAGTLRDVSGQRQLQDQLLQAQKLDAIGKLTGGIAHDFNNLLASVLSGIALLEKRGEVNESGRRILNMMNHAAKQGTQLISRMLTFSRRQNLRPDVVRIGDLAASLDGMLTPVLSGVVRLEWELKEPLWPAYVDPSQLELAIMNLVINARDAMADGGVITIVGENRTRTDESTGRAAADFLVISVSDTGAGIPLELQSRVIEPFFTTKDAGKGTGLGLSSVFGFAQQSGGSLRLFSEVGRGTTVEIWLPRSMEDASTPEPVPHAAPEGSSLVAARTILLVDDSEELRHLTELHLRDAGYHVVSAAGAVEALSLIEQSPKKFDVILTDYAMPVMSGLEVIRFARTLRASWPAVIISGYAEQSDIANRPNDVLFVSKPFNQQTLLGALAEVLEPQKAH